MQGLFNELANEDPVEPISIFKRACAYEKWAQETWTSHSKLQIRSKLLQNSQKMILSMLT